MTNVPPPYSPPQSHHLYYPPRKKRVWPWVLVGLSIPAVLVGGCTAMVVAAGTAMDTTAPTSVKRVPAAAVADFVAPTSTLPVAAPTPAGPAATITRDGTYLVGANIVAGTYQTTGGRLCYWERLSALTGSFAAIITNGADEGQQFVTILASDKAFKTQGCGTWTLVPE